MLSTVSIKVFHCEISFVARHCRLRRGLRRRMADYITVIMQRLLQQSNILWGRERKSPLFTRGWDHILLEQRKRAGEWERCVSDLQSCTKCWYWIVGLGHERRNVKKEKTGQDKKILRQNVPDSEQCTAGGIYAEMWHCSQLCKTERKDLKTMHPAGLWVNIPMRTEHIDIWNKTNNKEGEGKDIDCLFLCFLSCLVRVQVTKIFPIVSELMHNEQTRCHCAGIYNYNTWWMNECQKVFNSNSILAQELLCQNKWWLGFRNVCNQFLSVTDESIEYILFYLA